MCFTPWVSLTTAVLEFFVATFILIRYKDYLVPAFSAILIYTLGLYQFTEFMLCTSGNPHLWAAIGFATYNILPAIVLHLSIRFTGEKFKNWLLYIPAIILGAIALLNKDFVVSAKCEKVFVLVQTLFPSMSNLAPTVIYLLYYFVFMISASVILVKHIRKNTMGRIYIWWISLIILTVGMALILIVIIPALGWQFPSVYCEFSLLFSVAAIITSEIYHKKKKKERLIV